MVGQSGIGAASAASAVAQRYRDAESIQTQRVPPKPEPFASALVEQPSVVATVGWHAPPPPARLAPEAAVTARPAHRSVLASPALAKRGAAAYEAAAAIGQSSGGLSGAGAESAAPSGPGVSIAC